MRKNKVSSNIAFGLVFLVMLLVGGNYVYQAWDHRTLPVESSPSAARILAYQSLSDTEKARVVGWEEASAEEYVATADHQVYKFHGTSVLSPTNIKGRQTYRVTFKTTNDAFMGPITVYVNKGCDSVIGYDLQY